MNTAAGFLGALFALTSAFVWGGGDFSGGFAARRIGQYQVLALSSLSGTLVLVAAALLLREGLPSFSNTLWAALAGACGAAGVTALYRALAIGPAASVAPVAAVVGAVLPVGFSILSSGLPAPLRLAGFGLAFAGIWLVSRSGASTGDGARRGFLLACFAGTGFAGFFIFIARVEPGQLFSPLVVARLMAVIVALALLRAVRQPFPPLKASRIGLFAGVLDAGGNVFYLLATQLTRLDVAAVLVSLYPASTVLLSSLILKEKISAAQWAGVGLCLAAIVLITV